ncbi:MAG: hypothetical protein Q9227_004079 [Pyrenula ochraceoflavens]
MSSKNSLAMSLTGRDEVQWLWQLVLILLLLTARDTATATPSLLGNFFGVPGNNATFDYVIVGGGTSGLTVAKRLVESGHTVAVVEAGSFYESSNGNLSQIPAYATRGSSGRVTDVPPLVDWGFITTPQSKIGLSPIPGFNSGKLIGFANAASTIDPTTATRSSSETAFLRAAIEENEPLTVYVQSSAKKILFDDGKKATGVHVSTSGFTYTLSARQEVIVAAGVFKTPQLLMVSGIGPSSTLQDLGISVVSALDGVGQGIWDHTYFGVRYKVNVTTDQGLEDPATLHQANVDFLESQTGPLTNVGADLIGWEKVPSPYRSDLSSSAISDLAGFPSDWPELELLPISAATFPVNDTSSYATITIAGVAPISRGNVTISSTDTDDAPVISPNWLTSRTDQEVAIQGFKVARDIAAASGIVEGPEVAPGPAIQTDAQILQYIRQTAYTIHHAVASCT